MCPYDDVPTYLGTYLDIVYKIEVASLMGFCAGSLLLFIIYVKSVECVDGGKKEFCNSRSNLQLIVDGV